MSKRSTVIFRSTKGNRHGEVGRSENGHIYTINAGHAHVFCTELAEEIESLRALLGEIREAVAYDNSPTPIEQPSPDAPWLPVGLMVKISEKLEGAGQ